MGRPLSIVFTVASLPLPKDRTLQTADILKNEITTGRFIKHLPGERELARRMNVSRKTLRKAIELLESEEWLEPARPGRRRQIHNGALSKSAPRHRASLAHKRIVIVAPNALDQMGGAEKLFQSELNRLCSKSSVDLMHRHIDVRHMDQPGHRLAEFVEKHPAELYLLQHSSLAMQRWFTSSKHRGLVLGDRWEELDIPSVSGDMAATATHAASLLQRRRHRHIALLFPEPVKRGLEIFANQLATVNASLKITLAKHDDSPESISAAATKLLTHQNSRPTAILTPSVHCGISALTTAFQHGLRVPSDLSVLCLSHDRLCDYTSPTLAGYEFDMTRFAKEVHRSATNLLRHPSTKLTEPTLVMPDFVNGRSIGAAPV